MTLEWATALCDAGYISVAAYLRIVEQLKGVA